MKLTPHGSRTPLAAARRDLPSAFARIVDRAIDPDASKRYESADMLGAELASLAPGRATCRETFGGKRRSH